MFESNTVKWLADEYAIVEADHFNTLDEHRARPGVNEAKAVLSLTVLGDNFDVSDRTEVVIKIFDSNSARISGANIYSEVEYILTIGFVPSL